MALGRQAGSSQALKRAIKKALHSGVDPDDKTISQAYSSIDSVEDSFRKKSFSSWRRADDALVNLQGHMRAEYRPCLEKALCEATAAGVDANHMDVLRAKLLLDDLQETEAAARMHVNRRERIKEQAKEALKLAMHSSRDWQLLDDTILHAEKVGLAPESEEVRQAKSVQAKALISIQVARRGAERRQNEVPKKKQLVPPLRDKSFLRKGTGRMSIRMSVLSVNPAQLLWAELLASARSGQHEEVAKLLARGVDCDAYENGNGKTALCLAAQKGHIKVVKCLLEANASLDTCDDAGNTALLLCVASNDGHRVLSTLCTSKADVNATNAHGKTALHVAVTNQRFRCVRTLLACKVNAATCDGNGQRPLDLAASQPESVARTLVLDALLAVKDTDEGAQEQVEEDMEAQVAEQISEPVSPSKPRVRPEFKRNHSSNSPSNQQERTG